MAPPGHPHYPPAFHRSLVHVRARSVLEFHIHETTQGRNAHTRNGVDQSVLNHRKIPTVDTKVNRRDQPTGRAVRAVRATTRISWTDVKQRSLRENSRRRYPIRYGYVIDCHSRTDRPTISEVAQILRI